MSGFLQPFTWGTYDCEICGKEVKTTGVCFSNGPFTTCLDCSDKSWMDGNSIEPLPEIDELWYTREDNNEQGTDFNTTDEG